MTNRLSAHISANAVLSPPRLPAGALPRRNAPYVNPRQPMTKETKRTLSRMWSAWQRLSAMRT